MSTSQVVGCREQLKKQSKTEHMTSTTKECEPFFSRKRYVN
jgi:hypothetical protein